MKKLLIILLLAGTANGETILAPNWSAEYAAAYHDAIAPVPIIVDRITLDYLRIEDINVTRLSVEQIRIVQIGIDYIGADKLTIFSYKEVVELGTYLNDAVNSVRLEHAITRKDWAGVAAIVGADIAGKIRYLKEGGIYPKVATSFFIGIGEVRSVEEAELALSIRGLDSFLVPVYDPSDRTIISIFNYVVKQKAKVIPAIDYRYGGVETQKLIAKYIGNIKAVVLLWGQQNAIDLDPSRYAACLEQANLLRAFVKSLDDTIPVWIQIAPHPAVYDGRTKTDWWLSYIDFTPDGYIWWTCYELDSLLHSDCLEQAMAKTPEGMDFILCGQFGFTPGWTWDDEARTSAKVSWRRLKPELRKKVNGIILQGVQNWASIPVKEGL